MSVLVYAAGRAAEEIVAQVHSVWNPLDDEWRRVASWAEFERRALLAKGPVLLVVDRPGRNAGGRVVRLKGMLDKGLVIVSPPAGPLGNTRGPVAPSAIPSTALPQIVDALYDAKAANLFRTVAVQVEATPPASPLDHALEVALAADPPERSVVSWGGSLGRSADYVRALWRGYAHAGSPKEFLQEALLQRAILLRPPHVPWHRVAARLAVEPRRLGRTCRRRFGGTLDEAAEDLDLRTGRRLSRYVDAVLGMGEPPPNGG